ncbi:hypothetical protein [Sedimenticola hydrogenitrophicus]|uniref:hypothetical protein n=1 Tax=Sedimenticola hydrogenitrophicus TaxID=2967975 RepID=UPI0023B1B17A|nr:hypothetical protein [Sedimenticola hydrogenitrophicus]
MSTNLTLPGIERFSAWRKPRPQRSVGTQPDWAHLPERLWRRNSALLNSLHEKQLRNDP